MKYITGILILVTLAFAQDVYRLNESTFVYPCIGDSIGVLNFVGLPLESDYVNATDFDPDGNNINSVSVFNAAEQAWMTAGYHPALGWGTDFPVETGRAYMLNALNNFDFVVTGDSVDVVYDLVTTPSADFNHIVHPLSKFYLDSLSEIGDDIGIENCSAISKWDNLAQSWSSTTYNSMFSIWSLDQESEVGQPLSVLMTENITWPSGTKMDNNSNVTDIEKDIPKSYEGGPRIVYFHLQDYYGNELNFPEEASQLTFQTSVTSRPSDILTQNDFNCGFTMLGEYSVAYVNTGNFESYWDEGDGLVFETTCFGPMFECGYYLQLDNSYKPIYLGFEPIIPGTGNPRRLEMLHLHELENPPVTTLSGDSLTLSWDKPTGATGYNIYESDNPYGTFSLVASTTATTWQTEVTENKKFYYVTTTNSNKSEAEEIIFVKQVK